MCLATSLDRKVILVTLKDFPTLSVSLKDADKSEMHVYIFVVVCAHISVFKPLP